MPITRTPWIDDDGSGHTGTIINNAEKQVIYNQIDALFLSGTFTPVDASTVNLIFPTALGVFFKIDRLVHFQLQVIYPATSSGLPAYIGGLPYVIRGAGGAGAVQGFGGHRIWYLWPDQYYAGPRNPTTGAAVNNVELSGANIILSGTYLTD